MDEDSRATGQGSPRSFAESIRLTDENARRIAGGANSDFRVGRQPGLLVFERGEGPYLFGVTLDAVRGAAKEIA